MNFTSRRRKSGLDNVPMINLVFLLLIFFLLTAQITPTTLLEVEPPEGSTGEASDRLPVIVMDAEGRVAFDDVFGRAGVLERLGTQIASRCEIVDCTNDPIALTLRADAGAQGRDVAALIGDIAGLGSVKLTLTTVAR
ncbi:MAG: biopolymer transporter ExbD [Pseudomonadota bacterium]